MTFFGMTGNNRYSGPVDIGCMMIIESVYGHYDGRKYGYKKIDSISVIVENTDTYMNLHILVTFLKPPSFGGLTVTATNRQIKYRNKLTKQTVVNHSNSLTSFK